MPQSLSRVLIHTVFSTKNRAPMLRDATFRDALHAYVGGCAKTLDCLPIRIGGTEDHVSGRIPQTTAPARGKMG